MDKDTLCPCGGKPLSLAGPAFGDELRADSPALPLSERLALTGEESAATFALSHRFWDALDSAGKVPRALKFGRSKRWSVETLREWTRLGCPCRSEFERLSNPK
jgi:hypothetical protein